MINSSRVELGAIQERRLGIYGREHNSELLRVENIIYLKLTK